MKLKELRKVMKVDAVAFDCPQGLLVLGIGENHCYDDLVVSHVATIPFERVETHTVLGMERSVKVPYVEVRAFIKGKWTEDTIPAEE